AKAFFDAKIVWLESQPVSAPSGKILDDILNDEVKGESKQISLWQSGWFKYAAAASVILVTVLVFLFNGSGEKGYESKSLSDGSKIDLHGDSKLEVINFTKDIREVRIIGKAYFDIERDEKR